MSETVYHTPGAQCPHCRETLDAAGSDDPDHRQPQPGDATVCLYCAGTLIYTPSMTLRPIEPTDLEQRTTAERDALLRAVVMVMNYINRTERRH